MFEEIAWTLLWFWLGVMLGYFLGVWANERGRESREEEEREAAGLPLPQDGQTRWEPRK